MAALGFLVGGYDDAGVGEAWEVTLPDRAVEQIATTANGGGAAWRGQSDVVTRIVRGSDLELLGRLAAAHKTPTSSTSSSRCSTSAATASPSTR